ncbi:Na(+)-translocating NADH-quinone reductase subunit F [Planctomycetes bacterium CA13]|uniref:Na(+)-translocating NADH-quinone reductase subunit F n=1 Tax=Novipirellula herctigrandis TaxID=2527986 RepID=A0A5C5YVM9_9BACT|nr:Na(+)-translocating NADH-quinone reductase subunit F [Planctomycetes bacterium CA13]
MRDVKITLKPSDRTLSVPLGSCLEDSLYDCGFEFPCGGGGTCGKCRVRVLGGCLDANPLEVDLLGQSAVDEGWRLACQSIVTDDVTLQMAQWDASVLLDESAIEVTPRDGLAIAIDLGTTTIAAQLVDLQTGNVLAVQSDVNPQAVHGADIMSRVRYGVNDNGDNELQQLVRRRLGEMVEELVQQTNLSNAVFAEVAIVGNTVMHHLFCGIDLTPLASCPFKPSRLGAETFTAAQLGWNVPGSPKIHFLPCLGGFIGSDVLAGVIATRMDQSTRLQVLIDLGTNGEIVVSDGKRMLCAATAAGPAFEGARIQMGMRAAQGAIDRVDIADHDTADPKTASEFQCHVIGGGKPKGICGSGLIDAVACALQIGRVEPSGKLNHDGNQRMHLHDLISLHQCDIRELQLAKGAIAAGVQMLLGQLDRKVEDVDDVFLCGAFGNYLDIPNATRLGLLTFDPQKVIAMGNTALLGAKTVLLSSKDIDSRILDVCNRIEHFGLSEDREFMDVYVSHMPFPIQR